MITRFSGILALAILLSAGSANAQSSSSGTTLDGVAYPEPKLAVPYITPGIVVSLSNGGTYYDRRDLNLVSKCEVDCSYTGGTLIYQPFPHPASRDPVLVKAVRQFLRGASLGPLIPSSGRIPLLQTR